MKALGPAVVASIALHTAVFAALPRSKSVTRPAPVPAAVDVEVVSSGGVASSESGPHVAAARFEPKKRPQIRRALHRPNASSTSTLTSNAIPTATWTAIPTSTLTSIATLTPIATPTGPSTSTLRTMAADLDLSAFFDRLQRAAQRCSGPRPGEGKIRFCVGANGAPIDVALVQSTGNFALDDAALHCVIPGAAPFPHTDRCLVVPLEFH